MKAVSISVLAAVVGAAVLGTGNTGAQSGNNLGPTTLSARAQQVALTQGAAPGYVDDQLCASCHQDLYQSFQQVGMARSFYPPSEAEVIENFEAPPFFHQPSQRYYEMRRLANGTIRFRRYQLDDAGNEINAIEKNVDWVLGSGNHSRTYLFRTQSGALFQLPVAWYTQEAAWRMAPGFDQPEHQGLGRRVQHECMFCHNAYPDLPAGSDAYLQPHHFDQDLPHGIGCQRCHGPGGAHVLHGFADQVDFEALTDSILNPAALEPERRRDICYQCHMQPSVALMGIRRFGRNIYSYRPGERLADYVASVDVVEEGRDASDRFEINHHPYRLEQSACFQQSAGALSCLTCHDPHRKVPPADRVAHYRKACTTCHQLDDCTLESMATTTTTTTATATGFIDGNDCAGCHMPRRRSQDVVHVVMTDHRISRTHAGEALVAPREESTPVIIGAQLMDASAQLMDTQSRMSPASEEVYRAMTVLRAGGGPAAGRWFEKKLAETRLEAFEPNLDLARLRLRQQRFGDAAAIFRRLLTLRPEDATLTGFMALAQDGLGAPESALEWARKAVTLDPSRTEAYFDLGRLLFSYQQPALALPALRQAVELQSNSSAGWYHLSAALAGLGRRREAIAGLRQTLRVDPSQAKAYFSLGRLLLAAGQRKEALRYLRHGVRVAVDPDMIAVELARIEAIAEAENQRR